MNRKSIYWLGLGSGLVIGAILVQLLSLGDAKPSLDQAALEEAAARYGYRLVEEDESAWIVKEKVVRTLYIPDGMTNEAIVDWLVSSGLVDSREEVLEELERRPESAVRPGYYEFEEPLSVAELVAQLTGREADG